MNPPCLDIGDARTRELLLPEMHRCWGMGLDLESYRDYLQTLERHPWAAARIRTLVLRGDDGEDLAALDLHATRGWCGGREVLLGGIARVLTPERLRRRGHATRLLRATLDLLRQEGVDGAYLYSDIESRFYERLGFTTVDALQIDRPLESLPERAVDPNILPLEAEHWSAVRAIYDRMGRDEAFWMLRDPDHWDFLLSRALCRSRYTPGDDVAPLDRVVVRDGKVIAYAIARTQHEETTLLEFGMESPDVDLLDRLLGSLRAEGTLRGCRRLIGPWPPGRWGRLFEGRLQPILRADAVFMIAPLTARLDSGAVEREVKGGWRTDRI